MRDDPPPLPLDHPALPLDQAAFNAWREAKPIQYQMSQMDETFSLIYALHRAMLYAIMEEEALFRQIATKVMLAEQDNTLEGEVKENIEYDLQEIEDNLDYYGERLD